MDYQALLNALEQNSVKLITLGGSVNPYVGGVVTLIIVGLIVYLGIKAKSQAWGNQQNQAGKDVNNTTGQDQGTSNNVQHSSDDFFNKK